MSDGRHANCIEPRSSGVVRGGGSDRRRDGQLRILPLADAPRAQRKNAELAVAAAVTAATAYNARAPRLNAVRVVAITHPSVCLISTPPMIALPRMMSVGAPAGALPSVLSTTPPRIAST